MADEPRFGIDEHSVIRRHGANLPHWRQDRSIYHVTFRLMDSLPSAALNRIHEERRRLTRIAAQEGKLTPEERARLKRLEAAAFGRCLDEGHGSCALADPAWASVVVDSIRYFDGERYLVHAYCVMPNHVHVVVQPLPPLDVSVVVGGWKSHTAHRFVREMGAQPPIWQHEPFDHIIRSEASYVKTLAYVEGNPKAAGLHDWPWTWSAARTEPPA